MAGYAPPMVLTLPQNQTVEEGNKVKLHITVTGYPLPAIQWFCNGTLLADCTNFILEFSNAQPFRSCVYTAIIANSAGSLVSAPNALHVIAPVERRPVPGINLFGDAGSLLNLDSTDLLNSAPLWTPLDSVSLTSTSQHYFDLTAPLPSQRFYRAWQTGAPSMALTLDLHKIPAITLTGNIGNKMRVDGINRLGPTDARFTLDTVTLTNTSQLYFDVSAPGQPSRLYRLVPVP